MQSARGHGPWHGGWGAMYGGGRLSDPSGRRRSNGWLPSQLFLRGWLENDGLPIAHHRRDQPRSEHYRSEIHPNASPRCWPSAPHLNASRRQRRRDVCRRPRHRSACRRHRRRARHRPHHRERVHLSLLKASPTLSSWRQRESDAEQASSWYALSVVRALLANVFGELSSPDLTDIAASVWHLRH